MTHRRSRPKTRVDPHAEDNNNDVATTFVYAGLQYRVDIFGNGCKMPTAIFFCLIQGI